jgi:hypothetical protein
MMDIVELVERCEAASGPDRELDRDIELAFPYEDAKHLQFGLPQYTGSMDWAMTLVPEWWKLRQMNYSAPCADDRKWHVNLHGGREGEDCFVGRGGTRALALTAAALRARAALATPSGKGE